MQMFGTVRGTFTLVGAGAAGVLIWISTQIGQGTTGGYWAAQGLFAAAGLTMALSQLFGGWTKWGMPRISAGVFLLAFLPVLVVAGWVLLAGQPDANWFQRHTTSWSSSISIDGLVDDLRSVLGVLAFGIGLVFGFTFDTAGPRQPGQPVWEATAPAEPAAAPETPEASESPEEPDGTEAAPADGAGADAAETEAETQHIPSAQG
jgi:hypothetical protein